MGAAAGDAALLQATLDRPEELHTADEGTRSAIEQQLMAYLTVRSVTRHRPVVCAAACC
jgi:hypothetical protein